jgi:hypothetical protein
MSECEHQWQQDLENVMFMDCVKCSAILRVKDFCRKCQGLRVVNVTPYIL